MAVSHWHIQAAMNSSRTVLVCSDEKLRDVRQDDRAVIEPQHMSHAAIKQNGSPSLCEIRVPGPPAAAVAAPQPMSQRRANGPLRARCEAATRAHALADGHRVRRASRRERRGACRRAAAIRACDAGIAEHVARQPRRRASPRRCDERTAAPVARAGGQRWPAATAVHWQLAAGAHLITHFRRRPS